MESFEEVGLYPDWMFIQGLVATTKWTRKGIIKAGKATSFQGVNVTAFNSKGKIISHIGYWNPEKIKMDK